MSSQLKYALLLALCNTTTMLELGKLQAFVVCNHSYRGVGEAGMQRLAVYLLPLLISCKGMTSLGPTC